MIKQLTQKSSFKVLVIGDSCVDVYRVGQIKKLNPEAPVPLISVVKTFEKEGMASNVANNLKALGSSVFLKIPARVSRKIRYIEEKTNRQLLRVDEDVLVKPYSNTETDNYDAIVVSDYAKGFVSDDLINELQKKYNKPIFVDTKKQNLKSYKNVYYKINELEFNRLKNIPSNLIVTLGSKGCAYNNVIYPGVCTDVVDVCGAGDVFLAALVYGYLEFKYLPAALKIANKAASISCKHLGNYTLTDEDLKCVF